MRTIGFPTAPRLDRLASPLIITPWPVIRNGRTDVAALRRFRTRTDCGRLVSGSLETSSEALFSFHSRYYCAIGLGSYLRLEVDASQLHARFPTHATLDPWSHRVTFLPTGLSPSLDSSIPLHSANVGRCAQVCNSTSPVPFGRDSVCRIPFSIAFTNGISIDFFSSPY